MESRKDRRRSQARAALRPWPEVIGGAVGAGLGVWLPFLFVHDPQPGWLVAGAIIGALVGALVPPSFAFVRAHVTYGHYALGERVSVLESERASFPQKPSPEEAALREFVWRLRVLEKKAVVMRDSAAQQQAELLVSEQFAADIDAWRHDVLALLKTQDAVIARRFEQGIKNAVGPEMHQARNELSARRDLLDRLITHTSTS